MSEQEQILFSLRDLIHELKDPFVALQGGLDLSFQDGFAAQERDHLQRSVTRNAQVMKRLLDDAGVYLSLHTQPKELEPKNVKLSRLLEGPAAVGAIVRSVLVVEDNTVALEVTLMMLRRLGVASRGAQTVEEGLVLFETEKPDLILCDLGLPGKLSGYDLARALQGHPLPLLVAVTGNTDATQEALEAGFHKVVQKPLGVSALKELLQGRNNDEFN